LKERRLPTRLGKFPPEGRREEDRIGIKSVGEKRDEDKEKEDRVQRKNQTSSNRFNVYKLKWVSIFIP
jgi:hypothetical protein